MLGLTACAAVASDSTLPPEDPRFVRLEAFFKTYDCPGPLHVQEYLQAADSHALDYRLLPAISLVESTCGAFERLNNRWGWDSVQSGFDSVPAGIDYITEQLAENPKYKGKTVREKLFTVQSLQGICAPSRTADAADRELDPYLGTVLPILWTDAKTTGFAV